jgi:hypothetical protein
MPIDGWGDENPTAFIRGFLGKVSNPALLLCLFIFCNFLIKNLHVDGADGVI